MNTSSPEVFVSREEQIKRLERVVSALSEAVKRSNAEPDRSISALRTSIVCQCIRCGASVSGDELLELPKAPAKTETARLKRLRKGMCPTDGCESAYCEFVMLKHPDLDWRQVLSPPENDDARRIQQEKEESESARVAQRLTRWRIARLAILVVVAVLLWIARQYYLGGQIPLLRQPEKFRVGIETEPRADRPQ